MIPWKIRWSNTGLNEVECISLQTIYNVDGYTLLISKRRTEYSAVPKFIGLWNIPWE